MATLSIINTLSMPTQGTTISGKHGAITLDSLAPFNISVTGSVHRVITTIAAGDSPTLYASASDPIGTGATDNVPSSFDILFFWSDQNVHLQLIDVNATGSNVIIPILANFPFVLGDGDILAAANETLIADGGTALRPIDLIVCGNVAGATTANVDLILID